MSHQDSDGLGDLTLWRSFVAVHRAGSVSAAARSLGTAQPTVTGHLQALERALGEVLFERGARGVVPTPRADDLAGRLAAPFDALGAVLATAHDGGAARDGVAAERPVRLGGPAEFLAHVALPALGPDVAAGVRVHVTPGVTTDLLDLLRSGRLDLVVATSRPPGRRLVAELLGDEELVLVAAPGVVDGAAVERDGPAALDPVPLLAYATDLPITRRYWRHVFGQRLEREPALVSPDLRSLRSAACAGAGVTALPRYLCERELADGRLVLLLDPPDPPVSTTYLVRRPASDDGSPGRAHPARVRRALLAATGTWR
ncbi:LysR family transcriptional regulator [Xylanimonas protaetiae]|uniref:LysR family transcriptional regulator n=1 Tax=Xylanimonas protaetiae TaxID=2509457 RepID=A0A4P6F0X2_9MICO|nr:LysR family transcriptional regulator [Xylanimonas protaetiae]QAY69094.1 LysR family transcriptional regulator [Xylanimonas protaetiae]